jgi:hypothetical protein
MAAFSTMALLGGGLLAGAAAGRLLGKKKPGDQPLAPGPTSPQGALAPPAPPIVNPADANMAANAAGMKQRKRAARGSLLTNPVPTSTTMPVAWRNARS